MNILETEWWVLMLPPEWWAEQEEESVLIADRDEVGCIEISTLRKENGHFRSSEVQDLAREESPEVSQWQEVELGKFTGLTGDFTEERTAVREWYVVGGSVLLFITYSCDLENAGMDDAAVDEILSTLVPAVI